LVICPTQRDFIYIALGFKATHPSELVLISLLFRLRFSSPLCREFDLRVYGSFHGCVNFLLVARVIFVSFRAIFVGFSCTACSFDSEVFGLEFFVRIMDRCLVHFVLDLDPSNYEFSL
jgi:hypothetical protein